MNGGAGIRFEVVFYGEEGWGAEDCSPCTSFMNEFDRRFGLLRKVHVRDVRLGMHIHEICGSWMDHPFWKKSFKLADEKELKALRECGIYDVWIDASKGLDVEAGTAAMSEEDEQLKVEKLLQRVAGKEHSVERRIELHEEMARARNIHTRAKEAVVSMFQDVRMGKALQLGEAAAMVDEINQSIIRNPGALLNLARLKNKDDYTYLHSVAVCALMIALGRQIGLDDEVLKEAGMAGLLHDIGKIMTPDSVLNKTGSLTAEEFEIMKGHPQCGWEILKNSYSVSETTLDVCLHHHERIDGSGYPGKLSGDEISLFARMGAVCDVYDAITSDRCYKKGWEPVDAIRKMAGWKDGNYDESVFFAFVKTVGIYPAGTLVKLKSGRLGVVTGQARKSLLTPIVKVFFSTRSNEPILQEIIDLSKSEDSISNIENSASCGFDLNSLMGM